MAFEELKAKHSVVWGLGPYEKISVHLAIAHEHLLCAVPAAPGQKWLDVATGTGEIAVPAARGGADVIGIDIAPELIATAQRRATDTDTEVTFEVGDAECLPYADAEFDIVTSTFGVMFAPDQRAAAAELCRVCKPGGTLALLTWHPTEGVADLFRMMSAYQPPRPEGVGNPFDWGNEAYLTELLGDCFDLDFEYGNAPQKAVDGEAAWELFATAYGPTKALAESLDPADRSALEREWITHFEGFRTNGSVTQSRPYVLTLGTRR